MVLKVALVTVFVAMVKVQVSGVNGTGVMAGVNGALLGCGNGGGGEIRT